MHPPYSEATDSQSSNPGTLFERETLSAALEEITPALNDISWYVQTPAGFVAAAESQRA